MSDDLIAIIGCCILGLMAHGAKRHSWMEWTLRVTYCLFLLGEWINIQDNPQALGESAYTSAVLIGTFAASGMLLFKPGRLVFSYLFTFINQIVAGRIFVAALGRLQVPVPAVPVPAVPVPAVTIPAVQVPAVPAIAPVPVDKQAEESPTIESRESPTIQSEQTNTISPADAGANAQVSPTPGADAAANAQVPPASAPGAAAVAAVPLANPSATTIAAAAVPAMKKLSFFQSFFAERVFVPESIPHMNALWIYVTTLAFLLTHMEIAGFQMPSIMIPLPVTLDQLFSYNFLGLIMLAICGTGIFITRKPLEVMRRLGLVKPKGWHVLVGIAGIFMTFAYDYLWSTYTHSQEGLGYADKLAHYNEGTFTGGAAPGPAFAIASATGICAGIGEETLIRGALQPVFGLLPAAFMHGVLHGQFAHAPLLILQVFGWSTIMGIIRRYTNTTTTIITHVGFNFLSTFLIAFNP